MARNAVKVKSGIFSYSAQGGDHIPLAVYVSGGCRRRALDKGCISPHWCPKLRSLLMDRPAGVDSYGVSAEISVKLTTDHEDGGRTPLRRVAAD
jgi:hypothetical protein